MLKEIVEIIEGQTKLLVPKESITELVPPKEPAFFNPKAKTNRDFSIIAYHAFLDGFAGPRIFLEGLGGLGARGLRVAKETDIEKVIINDLNPSALELAKRSAVLNNLSNVQISENEVCRFFSQYSKKGERGAIVDIDPFGSPSPYLDCAVRATMHGGLLSVTATDLQVLNGLFDNACKRRYGGVPIRVEYGNEIALRLVLGCLRSVAARMDIEIQPVVVESDMHYYRAYVRVLNRPDQEENLGYVMHCKSCGNRYASVEMESTCKSCNEKLDVAGPLWIGKLFERDFIEKMLVSESGLTVDKICRKTLEKCLIESDMAPTYYTLDEIASRLKSSPPSLDSIIEKLHQGGYLATPTSLRPTGFKTNASIDIIKKSF